MQNACTSAGSSTTPGLATSAIMTSSENSDGSAGAAGSRLPGCRGGAVSISYTEVFSPRR